MALCSMVLMKRVCQLAQLFNFHKSILFQIQKLQVHLVSSAKMHNSAATKSTIVCQIRPA